MMNRRSLTSTGSLVLLGVLFISLVILSGLLFKGWRIDLTENRQYTLSDGTYAVLEGMQEPVTLHYFFSEAASREFPQIRSYARWVDEMLDDMADRSGGKLTVRRIDPEPFSPCISVHIMKTRLVIGHTPVLLLYVFLSSIKYKGYTVCKIAQ